MTARSPTLSVRAAIPLFEGEIAPRFGFARRFLRVDLGDGCVRDRLEVDVSQLDWYRRLALLGEQGVRLLLVGGFNRRFLPFAASLGIGVSWGHVGSVETLLERICAGELEPACIQVDPGQQGRGPGLGPGCWGRGGGGGARRGGSGRGRGRGRARRQDAGAARRERAESAPGAQKGRREGQ